MRGFTTLSSFIFEIGQYIQEGEYLTGSFYMMGTLSGAALAFSGNDADQTFLKW